MDEFVTQQLIKLGLQQYARIFRENEINADAFQKLTIEDLRELLPGKVGPQRQIISAIDALVKTPSPTQEWKDHIVNNFDKTSSTQWNTAASALTIDDFSSCQDPAPYFDEIGKVILYIDNSNIFINTQQHAAKLLKFRHGIRFDRRCRIDVGKLVARATYGREIKVANLYGSEPPALDTVWKSIREKAVNVETHKKSAWTHREKQIDTSLVADAVEGITQLCEDAGENRAIILFTGDKDMLTVIKKAIHYGWKVEIWSYEAAISNEIKKEAKKETRVKIFYMDEYFQECTFSLTKWKKTYIPPERSFVVLFDDTYIQTLKEDDKNNIITDVVKTSTEILKIPTLVQFLTAYEMSKTVGDDYVPTSNRFGALLSSTVGNRSRKCVPLAVVCFPSEGTHPHRHENIKDGGKPLSNPNRPKYDFTKDVWSKKDKIQKSIPNSLDIITYQQYKQNVQIMKDEYAEDDDEPDDETLDFDYWLVERNHHMTNQKYSDFCAYGFRCVHGVKCQHAHSQQQKEYFKVQPNARRNLYKIKLCTHALKKMCKYENKRYLCSYAHDFYECMCVCCGEIGRHWADECPKRIGHNI